MKTKLLLLVCIYLLFPSQTKACGGYWSLEDTYYHLFDQTGMVHPSLLPFILDPQDRYYFSNNNRVAEYMYSKNIADWKAYFQNKLTEKEIHLLLLELDLDHSSEQVNIPPDKKEEFIDYISLARQVDNTIQITYDSLWEETDDTLSTEGLEKELLSAIEQSDSFYQQRYVYQLSKLALKQNKLQKIHEIVNKYLTDKDEKSAVHHYLLDHNAKYLKVIQGNKLAAAHQYLNNFIALPEKRVSTMNSFRFTLKPENYDQLTQKLSTTQEKTAFRFIKGFVTGEPNYVILKDLVNLNPNAELTNLTLARALNEELRLHAPNNLSILHKIECTDENTYKAIGRNSWYLSEPDIETSNLNNLTTLCRQMAENGDVEDKERWQLAVAQLEYLAGNSKTAQKWLNKLSAQDESIAKQKLLLHSFITVSELKTITDKEEKSLYAIYEEFTNGDFQKQQDYNSQILGSDSLSLFWDIVAEKYFAQADYAKSFLAVNADRTLRQFRDRCVLEDLLAFQKRKKQNLNQFEQLLQSRFNHPHPILTLKDYIATTYIYDFDYRNALIYLKEISEQPLSVQQEILKFNSIPKDIFSIYHKQCYECDFTNNLTSLQAYDNTSGEFKNKFGLIQKVDELQRSKDITDQLAYGYFLLNINRKGYYRDIFSYNDTNGTNRLFVKQFSASPYAYGQHSLPISYAGIIEVFEQITRQSSASRESKAMADWGIILARQALFEEKSSKRYDWSESYFTPEYSFPVDFDNYRNYIIHDFERFAETNTAFSKEIILECNYFQQFISLP